MNTAANNQPGKWPTKESARLIKRMPRQPRNQRTIVRPGSEDLVIASQIAAAAKQLHLSTMEIIQKTLSESYHYAAIGTLDGTKSAGATQDSAGSLASQSVNDRQ